MTDKQLLDLALEAGAYLDDDEGTSLMLPERLFERFAELVAAAERNRTWTQAHWTEYERSIVAAEREACAKVCEQAGIDGYGTLAAAASIRARGQA